MKIAIILAALALAGCTTPSNECSRLAGLKIGSSFGTPTAELRAEIAGLERACQR